METMSSSSVNSSDDLKNEGSTSDGSAKVSASGFDCTFGTKTWREDTTLIVEGKHLYVSSSTMSLLSPVFTQMFEERMSESGPMIIELEGKKFDDILEFLKCIYPNIMKTITLENVFVLLPLAVEFGTEQLKTSCENVIMKRTDDQTPLKEIYTYLSKALESNLADLRTQCIKIASKKRVKDLKEAFQKYPISAEAKAEIQSKLIELLEERLSKVNTKCTQCSDHGKMLQKVKLDRYLNGVKDPSTLRYPRLVYLEFTVDLQENTKHRSPQTVAHDIAWSISIKCPRNEEHYLKIGLTASSSPGRSSECNWICKVHGTMRLRNEDKHEAISRQIDDKFTAPEHTCCFNDVVTLEDAQDDCLGFLNDDDKITVECYFLVEKTHFTEV